MEPASGLVNRLRDELSRELTLEEFLVLKGIMMLCERHCARIKPAVNNLRHSLHCTATLGALDCDLINIWSVKLYSQSSIIIA